MNKREENLTICYLIVDKLVNDFLINDLSEKYSHIIANPSFRLISNTIKTLNLDFIIANESQNFYQIRVYKQHSKNLCGYHMLFTTLNLINYISSGFLKYLSNTVSAKNFWTFHLRTRKFLVRFADEKKLSGDVWSRDYCGVHGDLERIHLKAIIKQNEEFYSCFQ